MADSDFKPYGIVYCVTNLVNRKIYIGQTTRTLEQRWAGHIHSHGRNGCRLLNAAILKYGKDAFEKRVIGFANSQPELDALEVSLIATHQANNREIGYNIACGGSGGKQAPETVALRVSKTSGQKRSDEFRNKVSAVHKGAKRSAATREKISIAARSRRPPSPETRAKLSEAAKKARWDDERRARASASATGKRHSQETKSKLSAIFSGKRQSAETIAKRVSANTGRTRSEETKNRISEARKAYWAAKREAAILK